MVLEEAASAYGFHLLVERYRRPITRLALKITGDPDEAADIVQEVFVRAFMQLGDRKPNHGFAAWLNVVTRNAALDSLRRRGVRHRYAMQSVERPQMNPEELVVLEDAADRVRATLNDLPERYREVIELFYFERLTYREIAERLSIPLGTVKTFLRRALCRLRDEKAVIHLRAVA